MNMFAKILIKGELETVTGLHIGTGGAYSAIGAADSPVIRDVITGDPMIPASSLKGKLRSLLARKYNDSRRNVEDDCKEIKELFGAMKSPSRLIFSDMYLTAESKKQLSAAGINTPTEIKFENTIIRLSGIANPRQIERVIRSCKFGMNIIYDAKDISEAENDIKLLCDGMKLLQYDYLGGHGSRGYGKVRFTGLSAQTVSGEDSEELDQLIGRLNDELNGVCDEI